MKCNPAKVRREIQGSPQVQCNVLGQCYPFSCEPAKMQIMRGVMHVGPCCWPVVDAGLRESIGRAGACLHPCLTSYTQPVISCTYPLIYHISPLSYTQPVISYVYPLISHNLITHLHFRSSILYMILRFGISIIRRISRIQFLCDTDTEHVSACMQPCAGLKHMIYSPSCSDPVSYQDSESP